jgi:transposase
MDTSTVVTSKRVSAGRKKRRMRTLAEKRSIVEEVLRGPESVAEVARRHEVNANLVFSWKRQYEKGFLDDGDGALVPVKTGPKSAVSAEPRSNEAESHECVEIELGHDQRVRIRGKLALAMLDQLLSRLWSR